MNTTEALPERQDTIELIKTYFPNETIKPEFEPIGVTPRYKPAKAEISSDKSKGWFLRIFPILYSHKLLVILSLIMSFLGMLLNVSVPALIGKTIDIGLIDQSKSFLPYIYILIGIGIAHGILVFGSRYTHSRLTYHLEYDLRTIIYNHLTKLSFSFFDKIQSGQVISRANSDIRAVEMFLTFAPNIVMTLLTFSFALTYMLTMHVKLTIVALLSLPGVFKLSTQMRKVMFPLSWLNQSRVAEVTTVVDENINGIRVVKSFAAELQQIKLLAKVAQKLRWSDIQMVSLRARFMPFIGNLPRVGLAIVVFYGGYLAIQGEITIGTLVAFNTYVMMVTMPFRMFAMFLMQYERARASANRIYEILDEQIDIVESPSAIDLVDVKGIIEFRNVAFGYKPEVSILKDFNLDIKPGEAVAIVGRTGSGKSTITRLLTRFYDVTEGAVTIDDHDIRDLSLVSLRASIGTVLDEPFLFSARIRENISYGRPQATLDEIISAAKSASAHEFICDLPEGYETVIGERGYTLSGGQRQRIAIARTLLLNPRILILDDATSSVDVQVEAEIHKALSTLMKNRTTIVIAHRLSTILLADRVVLLEGGKVVASGTHAELMWREPRYVEVLARAEEDNKEMKEKLNQPKAPEAMGKLSPIGRRSADGILPPDIDGYGGSS